MMDDRMVQTGTKTARLFAVLHFFKLDIEKRSSYRHPTTWIQLTSKSLLP